ncbi:MAG: hypothetical protein HRU38_08180 [Saccharospirillaceae bacterium]|nr:hypothetical protein [Pseudomonadales bacterium]NRB78631.1 hypothetical protein [Saccharospirillaceae bacterium]
MPVLNIQNDSQIMMYVMLCITMITLFLLWQSNRRQRQMLNLTTKQIESLKQEIFIVNQGAIGVGKKLLQMQFSKNKPQSIHTKKTNSNNKSFKDEVNRSHAVFLKDELPSKKIELAHQLSEEGANNQKISQSLGFSFAEVQLIQSMHTQHTLS